MLKQYNTLSQSYPLWWMAPLYTFTHNWSQLSTGRTEDGTKYLHGGKALYNTYICYYPAELQYKVKQAS